MLLNAIVGLALATGAIAAPLVESGLNSSAWTPDHILQPDEVILYGEGRSEYHALMASQGVSLDAPELEDLNASLANRTRLNARDDCHTTAVVTDRTQTFIDWDVQMSPVVIGTGSGIDVWTTQTVINIKGTVPNGYSGVMITKPIKTRKYGRALTGCLGSQTQTGTFMADSYQEGSYAGVKWVSGAITMCMKKEFPLSRCTGGGNFI